MKICYWSVAWGDYRYMLQALIHSIRYAGDATPFIAFSDGPLRYCDKRDMDGSIERDALQFWKFKYLQQHMKQTEYDAYVFIDADHFFVRKPKPLEELLAGAPWHSFLESPLNAPETTRKDWWHCPNERMVELMRSHGCAQQTLYNSNGGFWVCRKDFVDDACRFAYEFHEDCNKAGHKMPEEVAIGWLTQYMCGGDNAPHTGANNKDVWGSDWTGQYKNRLPDGKIWELTEYMTGAQKAVNPAIVHAMRSKDALMKYGAEVLNLPQ